MTAKIRLASHISVNKSGVLAKICKHLFEKTCVSYFCYLRRYKDNTFTFLPTTIELGEFFFEEGQYSLTWFAGTKFEDFHSGYFFWDIARQMSLEDSQNVYSEVTKRCQLRSGVEIIEKTQDYCDFYSFGSPELTIYSVPLHYFYQFVYYFKQESTTLLLNAHDDRLLLTPPEIYLPPPPIVKSAEISSEFDVQRYYLTSEVFLTKREVEILRILDKGETVKCVADNLCISPRTLEHHITNIKNKLNVSRTAEMLYLAKKYHILF